MSKPTLLVLGSTFPKALGDGTPAFVLDLAIEQLKQFDVTVMVPMVPGAKRTEVISGVKVIRYRYWPFAHTLADGAILDNLKANPSNYLQVPLLLLALYRNIQKLKPKLVHAHWIIPQGIIATLAAPKAKLIVTTHGGDIYALNSPLIKRLKIWVLQRASKVSTVNSQMKQQLQAWGIAPEKIAVLPMGVDLQGAKSVVSKRKPNQLALVGRLVEKKGIEFLLEALRMGQGKLPQDLHLVIAGDGPSRKALEAKAKGLPVTFLGKQTQVQVRQLFSESAIALLPSVTAQSGDQEGLPVTMLEAAAAGCCIIASDLPGINEVIRNRETGLLTEQGNADSILEALITALGDPDLVAKCAKNVQLEVARFDHAAVGASYNKLIGEA
ncbi:MAG: hypothetical protein RL068_525 [Actinomycetota bacterium]|jgi:glycosyltransferase involved in cell wall biosynthesis